MIRKFVQFDLLQKEEIDYISKKPNSTGVVRSMQQEQKWCEARRAENDRNSSSDDNSTTIIFIER